MQLAWSACDLAWVGQLKRRERRVENRVAKMEQNGSFIRRTVGKFGHMTRKNCLINEPADKGSS